MDILMFQSRCRDLLAKLWQEGMKLQEKRRNFQSRCRDLQPYKLFIQQKVYVLPLHHLHYHNLEIKNVMVFRPLSRRICYSLSDGLKLQEKRRRFVAFDNFTCCPSQAYSSLAEVTTVI